MKGIEDRWKAGNLLSRFCSGAGLACTKIAERKKGSNDTGAHID